MTRLSVLLWLLALAVPVRAHVPRTTLIRPASNVTANGQVSALYGDQTWATTAGLSLVNGTNSFTVIAQAVTGGNATNTLTLNLPATVAFTYDTNGNLLSDGQRTFEYDDENQLSAVQVAGAWRSEFVYDGLFRRRLRREHTWNSSAWLRTNEVRYVYDGALVMQERDSNNTVLVTFTRGPDLGGGMQGAGGIGGLLARTDGTGNYYYHADGGGNVTALMDTQDSIAARYLYDPFGNEIARSGPLAGVNLYRFSSKELHPQSGLYSYGRRFYEPNLQRWINRDPLGVAA